MRPMSAAVGFLRGGLPLTTVLPKSVALMVASVVVSYYAEIMAVVQQKWQDDNRGRGATLGSTSKGFSPTLFSDGVRWVIGRCRSARRPASSELSP